MSSVNPLGQYFMEVIMSKRSSWVKNKTRIFFIPRPTKGKKSTIQVNLG